MLHDKPCYKIIPQNLTATPHIKNKQELLHYQL